MFRHTVLDELLRIFLQRPRQKMGLAKGTVKTVAPFACAQRIPDMTNREDCLGVTLEE